MNGADVFGDGFGFEESCKLGVLCAFGFTVKFFTPDGHLSVAMRDGQRAREDLGQMLRRQCEALGRKKPAFGIYFNCCARGNSLYGIPGIDSAYIRQALGEVPLIGMFGGYELAPLGRANHLFAYTGVLALIGEND